MAFVGMSWTRSRDDAKRALRYIQARRGRDNEKVVRELWGSQGALDRQAAYRLVDEASRGSYFYRISLSPDPAKEDTDRDLHLQELTAEMMVSLSDRLDTWVASVHDDHAPHRHVSILAITRGHLGKVELAVVKQRAAEECREQRRELEASRARGREKEERWERAADSYSRG